MSGSLKVLMVSALHGAWLPSDLQFLAPLYNFPDVSHALFEQMCFLKVLVHGTETYSTSVNFSYDAVESLFGPASEAYSLEAFPSLILSHWSSEAPRPLLSLPLCVLIRFYNPSSSTKNWSVP